MHTAIVIPCLDEEATLRATCQSLGFGAANVAPPVDATLILVDNGSTDGTWDVMEGVQRISGAQVVLSREPQRGYVPPRHRGVLVARDIEGRHGHPDQDVLILQADADTVYDSGYIAAMRDAARPAAGVMVEGVAHATQTFLDAHPGYHHLADGADRATERFLVDEPDEVIIDDQVAGYRLSDYLAWGGHRREYDAHGDEIHAETSRLYLRGKISGGRRVRTGKALAFPSRRKVELDPLLHFATEGFPRTDGWRKRWRAEQGGALTLDAFDRPDAAERLQEAVFIRQAHGLILFGVLPIHVAQALGRPVADHLLAGPMGTLVSELADITPQNVAANPGRLLEAGFALIERRRNLFEACLR